MANEIFGTQNESLRETWIKNKLENIQQGKMILDAGAGDQHHKKNCPHLKYVSQDFGKYDGKGNNIGLQTNTYDYGDLDIVCDITSIPREDESFDAVLCTEVLEHVVNPIKVIQELSRLLKTKGILILTAPFCSLTHFAPYHFSTGFNQYWYEEILPQFNLKIISMEGYGSYFEYMAQEIHRLLSVTSQYCEAPFILPDEMNSLKTIIKMLERYHTTSKDSWQLLNFGFLVVAEKTLSERSFTI